MPVTIRRILVADDATFVVLGDFAVVHGTGSS